MVDVYVKRVRAAQNSRLADVAAGQVGLQHAEVLRHVVVEGQYAVAVSETHLVGQFVDIYGVVLIREISLSPDAKDAAVSDDGEDEVVKNTSGHHEQALPGLLGAELPGLGIFLHALEVQGLVDHAADLAVSAQRQPAYAILGLGLGRLGEKFSEPLGLLGREKLGTSHVEKEEEFVHTYAEKLRKSEVAELVNDDEHREGQYHLKRLDQYYHLIINSLARRSAQSLEAKMSSSEGFATKSAPAMHSSAMRAIS